VHRRLPLPPYCQACRGVNQKLRPPMLVSSGTRVDGDGNQDGHISENYDNSGRRDVVKLLSIMRL